MEAVHGTVIDIATLPIQTRCSGDKCTSLCKKKIAARTYDRLTDRHTRHIIIAHGTTRTYQTHRKLRTHNGEEKDVRTATDAHTYTQKITHTWPGKGGNTHSHTKNYVHMTERRGTYAQSYMHTPTENYAHMTERRGT